MPVRSSDRPSGDQSPLLRRSGAPATVWSLAATGLFRMPRDVRRRGPSTTRQRHAVTLAEGGLQRARGESADSGARGPARGNLETELEQSLVSAAHAQSLQETRASEKRQSPNVRLALQTRTQNPLHLHQANLANDSLLAAAVPPAIPGARGGLACSRQGKSNPQAHRQCGPKGLRGLPKGTSTERGRAPAASTRGGPKVPYITL